MGRPKAKYNEAGEKQCSKCGIFQAVEQFSKGARHWDGRAIHCKTCAKRRAETYAPKRKRVPLDKTKHMPPTPHRDGTKLCSYCREWLTLSHFSKHSGCWDGLHPYCKACANERRRKLRSVWYKQNIQRRLRDQYRLRLLTALRKGHARKACATLKLLGCTIVQLKVHLEKQFKPGMSWDNHTLHGWHIDHIRPCASFDLTDQEQQKQCFHYTNLQPLWAGENYSKGDTYSEPDKQGQSPASA